ncbi:hypothetical protein [Flavobacterium sp. 5]|uniref:hypothetical protein n=1 Tax=Flavobacterium sp. 5 TaxID=2035199 RepID=UPI000C2CC114|nr:hypothetical protein [Flavobacterium sp. 5]PKB16813.1 hypothetical protein CLU82_1963 [Flavobacterium sp. 5]
MEEKYRVNETQKRIEPTEKKCSYCRKKEMTLIDSCFFQTLFFEQKRANYLVVRKVNFNKVSIGVPRCESCRSIHEGADAKAQKYIFIGAGIMFVFPFLFSFSFDGLKSGIIPAIIVLIAGFAFKNYLSEKIVFKTDILAEKVGAQYSVIVQEFLEEGWQYEQPEA